MIAMADGGTGATNGPAAATRDTRGLVVGRYADPNVTGARALRSTVSVKMSLRL
jgi:hypothetical protein